VNCTVYLTTEQVIAINERFGGVLGDFGVVDAATQRCSHTFDGAELFLGIMPKAAALLHGLATTQGFIDGNKRTAWTATETFLAINRRFLRAPTIDAEVFMLAVAQNILEHYQVVEWLEQHER